MVIKLLGVTQSFIQSWFGVFWKSIEKGKVEKTITTSTKLKNHFIWLDITKNRHLYYHNEYNVYY